VNPKEFEKQVERILRILEAEGASITWNDRIPDPDHPGQLRQIDVSVRREGRLTLVECRAHARPQDVKWIEELYGAKGQPRSRQCHCGLSIRLHQGYYSQGRPSGGLRQRSPEPIRRGDPYLGSGHKSATVLREV
jgi:hypothetical protein